MANKRVTRYVVTRDGEAVAVFETKKNAEKYAEEIRYIFSRCVIFVETIRFRTPEAK